MIREISISDKNAFNGLSLHPLQSWEWGEFRTRTGLEVVRLGRFSGNKLVEAVQLTIHPLPFTNKYTIGYLPKCGIPSRAMLEALVQRGKRHNCIFIKIEPNIVKSDKATEVLNNQVITSKSHNKQQTTYNLQPSPHPLFTKYTFQLDITKSEEELIKTMHPKTRYNVKVAQKHGVKIQQDDSKGAFKNYLQLTFETTKRQKFFAHDRKYHTLMWETLAPSRIAHLLTATFKPDSHLVKEPSSPIILVAWIVFLFNGVLYYPYGASSTVHRNVMASNLMMWEAIRFGKKHGAKIFDMWGALGPDPDPKDPWYGFHKFKQGYGANFVEFVGSFDLVIEPHLYRLYNIIHTGRELFLKIKSYMR